MDAAAPLGDAMRRFVRLSISVCLLLCLVEGAAAAERYALVVSGASGGEKYAENQKKWIAELQSTLREKLSFPPAQLTVLAEGGGQPDNATRENVSRVLSALRQQVKPDDLLFVVLIGHGTFDGQSAKFNLVGPDMSAEEWKKLLDAVPGRLVFVNT